MQVRNLNQKEPGPAQRSSEAAAELQSFMSGFCWFSPGCATPALLPGDKSEHSRAATACNRRHNWQAK